MNKPATTQTMPVGAAPSPRIGAVRGEDAAPTSAQAEAPRFTLLCVDDEANILSSLKRLFRPAGYRLFTAGGGEEALQVMERESIDLVISDMRMPCMSGAQVLAAVRVRWPEAVRVLLTGYADIASTVEAINAGQIHRYISKPWDDNEILLVVREALERKELQREKARLEALTQRQNDELKALNAGLETKVAERTAELREAHEKLKTGFLNTIKTFSNLIELRGGQMAGHSRRVADHARRIAQAMELPAPETQDLFFAALLHDIGKIGLPDELLAKPFNQLTPDERNEAVKHPAKGEALLMGLEQLQGAARIIRAHHERFDGLGYPDRASGICIPLGARILAVANDYDAVQQGSLFAKRATPEEAANYLHAGRAKRYDPAVLDAFASVLGGPPRQEAASRALGADQLRPGMVLAKDLVTREGVLLLAHGYVIDDNLIRQIHSFEVTEAYNLKIHVMEGKP